MNQPFEQRELPASKKDFAISQYEEFVKKLEESLKIETQDMAVTYLEPSPSPEVDSILNTLLRLNARLMNVSNLIESTESVNVDEINFHDIIITRDELIKAREKEIECYKFDIGMYIQKLEETVDETEGYKKTVRDLELKIKELVKENEGLNRLVDSLQIPASNQATPSKKK